MATKVHFNPNIDFHEDEEEEEERLSFSDLPLNNSSSSFSHSQEYYKTSAFDQQDNLFEFFSEDFTGSTNSADYNYYPANNIIFCGKIIPVVAEKETIQPKQKRTQIQTQTQTRNESRVFPWKMKSTSFSGTRVSVDHDEKRFKSSRSFPVIRDDYPSKSWERCDFSRRKKAVIPAYSRWNILFRSFPMDRDIKTRKNKRKPASTGMFRSDDKSHHDEMLNKNVKTKKFKVLWGLLKVFAFVN